MNDINLVLTCILQTSNENNISPNMEMKTANRISPMKGLVSRSEPRELQNTKQSNINHNDGNGMRKTI